MTALKTKGCYLAHGNVLYSVSSSTATVKVSPLIWRWDCSSLTQTTKHAPQIVSKVASTHETCDSSCSNSDCSIFPTVCGVWCCAAQR